MSGTVRRLGYLSAAPTISTRPEAYSAGPRTHIVGVIHGFEAAGFEVRRYIKGDRIDARLTAGGVQSGLARSRLARLAGDLARLGLARASAAEAWAELGSPAAAPVDLVYERFATMQVLGRRFRHAGVPWILETQGLFFYETRVERAAVGLPGLARRIELAAYRDCDILIAVSDALRELLVREHAIPREKILVVPNAVEPERFANPVPMPRPFACLTLAFIGGLIAWQALDLLIEAMAALRGRGIELALLVLGDGVMLEEWRALAEKRGLADRVRFVGRVPQTEIPRWLAACDLGYSGQRMMAIGAMYHSPIKLYEYMAAGLPVVASAFDDASRLIEGRRTGFLFPAGDRAALEAALAAAHGAAAGLPEMGARARALVEAEHSWAARAAGMIAEIDRRLPAPGAPQPAPAAGEVSAILPTRA